MKKEQALPEADKLFFQADKLLNQGEITQAKELFEKAIEAYPKHGRSYNHLGWIHETKYKDYERAEECYKKALEFSPDYPPIYVNYAIILSTLEKYKELEEHLNKAMDIPGIDKIGLYNEFGIMYERQGNFEKAMDVYKKALTLSLNEKDVDIYKKAIDRCKMKLEVLA